MDSLGEKSELVLVDHVKQREIYIPPYSIKKSPDYHFVFTDDCRLVSFHGEEGRLYIKMWDAATGYEILTYDAPFRIDADPRAKEKCVYKPDSNANVAKICRSLME